MPDTTLHYTWSERSASIPLTEKEARLAMRLAENDVEKAASLLKVHASRFVPFREFTQTCTGIACPPCADSARARQAASRAGAVTSESNARPLRSW